MIKSTDTSGKQRYLIGTALGWYFKKSMARKRNSDGSAKHTMDCASLSEIKAKQGRSTMYCMRALDCDKASISKNTSALKLTSEEPSLPIRDRKAN